MGMEGKTILITGSTDGVGRMVAERLAADGAAVIVHGRSRERGEQVVRAIAAGGKGAAVFYAADFASLTEVRRFAETVLRHHPRIDVLVNNAGVGSVGTGGGKREESADGHELRFAVNHLAGFLLTHLLLERLIASAPARIVNVSSLGQQALDFDDVMLTHGYSGVRAYCQSKLAQILFTVDLAARLKGKGVTVTSLHPATYMNTTMVRQAGVNPASTVEEGAEAILQLVASPAVQGQSGGFYNGLRPARPNPQADDAEARRRLWDLSARLTGVGARPAASGRDR